MKNNNIYRDELAAANWDFFALIQARNYTSERLLSDDIARIWKAIAADMWLGEKETKQAIPDAWLLYSRAVKLVTGAKFEQNCAAMASRLWLEYFEPENIRAAHKRLTMIEPDPDIYQTARAEIMRVYHLTSEDLDYIAYFVAQCMSDADPQLTRSLYIYSSAKMTGKTTTARIITGILNGAQSWGECLSIPSSDIPTELQFSRFARPLATRQYCVLMDEAFTGLTTARYYAQLKSVMTSPTASIEIKFGGVVTMPAHRNYIYTSNRPISDIVSDESERRFNVIEFAERPEYMDYPDIFRMWQDYIYNCPRDLCTPENYARTLQNIEGARRLDIDDVKSALMSEEFAQYIEDYRTGVERSPMGSNDIYKPARYQVSYPRFFFNFLRDYRADRDAIKKAITEIFGEPHRSSYRSYYNISELMSILSTRDNEPTTLPDFADNNEELPF